MTLEVNHEESDETDVPGVHVLVVPEPAKRQPVVSSLPIVLQVSAFVPAPSVQALAARRNCTPSQLQKADMTHGNSCECAILNSGKLMIRDRIRERVVINMKQGQRRFSMRRRHSQQTYLVYTCW